MRRKLKFFIRASFNFLIFGRFAPTEYVVIDEKRLVYIVNSKVACSSIKKTLIRKTVCDDCRGLIHDELSRNTLQKLPVDIRNEYDFFTFVRNPFDRVVSCYVDKFIKERSRRRDSMYFDDYLFGYLATTKDFSDFVRRIIKIPFFLSDRHFLPQCKLITDQGLPALTIKKFESLEDRIWTNDQKPSFEFLPQTPAAAAEITGVLVLQLAALVSAEAKYPWCYSR